MLLDFHMIVRALWKSQWRKDKLNRIIETLSYTGKIWNLDLLYLQYANSV